MMNKVDEIWKEKMSYKLKIIASSLQTRMREGGSLCIDNGDNTEYNSTLYLLSTNDVRGSGYSRKVEAHTGQNNIDIGAYEYEFQYDCDASPYQYKIAKNDSTETITSIGNLILFPNPADQWYSIQLFSEFDELLNLSLFNSIGKLVFNKQLDIKKGENYFTFNREQLNPGIYYLISESQNQKFNAMKLILK